MGLPARPAQKLRVCCHAGPPSLHRHPHPGIRKRRGMDQLIVTGRDRERQMIHLTSERLSIGRALESDLRLSSPYVSRAHAMVAVLQEGVFVSDLDSFNGTFVNGARIDRIQLNHLDLIRVGDCEIRYLKDSPLEPPQAQEQFSEAPASAR